MKPVDRTEIVDYQTYNETRDRLQKEVLSIKAPRRIHVGDVFTFLFENRDTIRYQIQEMMRAEKIVKEKDIEHELRTYNGLLGGDGELGCTLLVELEDPAERAVKLREWVRLPHHIYLQTEDGSRARPSFDESQLSDDKLSSVQYLKFRVGGSLPVALGVDLPGLELRTELDAAQRAALAADLAS